MAMAAMMMVTMSRVAVARVDNDCPRRSGQCILLLLVCESTGRLTIVWGLVRWGRAQLQLGSIGRYASAVNRPTTWEHHLTAVGGTTRKHHLAAVRRAAGEHRGRIVGRNASRNWNGRWTTIASRGGSITARDTLVLVERRTTPTSVRIFIVTRAI